MFYYFKDQDTRSWKQLRKTLTQLKTCFSANAIAHASSEVELYAIEPSIVAREIGSNNYKHIRYLGELIGSLDSAKYDNYFDIVVLSHVVEHLSDPRESLVRISECVTNEGLVYIEVPNYYFHPSLEVGHLHCPTPRGLINLTRNSSLQIKRLSLNDHRSRVPLYITAVAERNAKSNTHIGKPYLPYLIVSPLEQLDSFLMLGTSSYGK